MSCIEHIKDISVIIANVAICAGAIFGSIQLYLINKQKKQATIEYYGKIRDERQKAVRQIQEFKKMMPLSVENFESNEELREAVLTYFLIQIGLLLASIKRFTI